MRSGASWSIGIKSPETSIHSAWCSAIASAEHYVYVENQFFISGGDNGLKNCIADAIVDRILKAHDEEVDREKEEEVEREEVESNKSTPDAENARRKRNRNENDGKRKRFRVFVIIPLLPSFRGEAKSRKRRH